MYVCDVCERADAAVFCFTDEAVLCSACDASVHGDTKSAEQHKRVSLTPSSDTAMCDVCQERNAVLFCSEDRALICRECDLMIHTANNFTAKHHRYLLQFVQVGLQTLPLPGDTGRKEDGTSKRIRRSLHAPSHAAPEASTSAATQQTIFQSAPAQTPGEPSSHLLPHVAQQQPAAAVAQPLAHNLSTGNLIDSRPQASSPTGQLISPFSHTEQPPFDPAANGAFGLGPYMLGPGADQGDMTRASELLGVPSLGMGFTAKDIDAAYLFGASGDLDADLSALLEVPDMTVPGSSTAGPSSYSAVPSAGAAEPKRAGNMLVGDGVVPDMAGPSKRQRT